MDIRSMKDLRRGVVAAVIGSFSIAALMGILALLSAGGFGEMEGRILLTTVTVGLESVAVLCYLTLSGHRAAAVGWVGAAASLVAAMVALAMIWGDLGDAWQLMLVTTIVAVTLAQVSLLVALVDGTGRDVPLLITLAAAGAVALMLISVVVGEDLPGADFGRLFGVLAILDVLGTVVLTALGVYGKAISSGGARAQVGGEVVLAHATRERLLAVARQRGVTPDHLVDDLLAASIDVKPR